MRTFHNKKNKTSYVTSFLLYIVSFVIEEVKDNKLSPYMVLSVKL